MILEESARSNMFRMAKEALTFKQLFDWRDEEAKKWRAFFEQNQQALELPCGVAQAKDIREMLLHIFAVDLRYAERLRGEDVTAFEAFTNATAQDLFETGDRASLLLREYAEGATEEELDQELEFTTRTAGTLKASRRKILIHTVMHGMRHWAQLASMLREKGMKTDWQHDYLATRTMP